ncbi:MAG: Gfo/Idh/MocA family protein [Fibrobacterota bacterium]
MAKYSVMVIGLGKRGGHHVQHFNAHPDFEVTAICDINEEQMNKVAEEQNLGDSVVKGTDAKAVAMEAKPDVLAFMTLPNIRKMFIQLAADCGAKMVAFEKPVSLTTEEGFEVKEIVEKSGLKAVLSYQHRYGSHYQAVKDIVDAGKIGEVTDIYANAMGWPAHMFTHMVHYSRWFAGNPKGAWAIGNASGKKKLESPDRHLSPDYLAGIVNYENGVHGVYEVGAGQPDVKHVAKWFGKNRIGVKGTKGYAEVYTNGGYKAVTPEGVIEGEGAMDYHKDMPGYIQDIADDLNGTKDHPCNFENAWENFSIWQAMYRSALDGGQVALPLEGGRNEVEEFKAKLKTEKVMPSFDHDETKEQFGL